jgi:hypothetical protein
VGNPSKMRTNGSVATDAARVVVMGATLDTRPALNEQPTAAEKPDGHQPGQHATTPHDNQDASVASNVPGGREDRSSRGRS